MFRVRSLDLCQGCECPDVAFAFVRLFESLLSLTSALFLLGAREAARLADAALQMAARNVSLAVKVIDRFPERQKQVPRCWQLGGVNWMEIPWIGGGLYQFHENSDSFAGCSPNLELAQSSGSEPRERSCRHSIGVAGAQRHRPRPILPPGCAPPPNRSSLVRNARVVETASDGLGPVRGRVSGSGPILACWARDGECAIRSTMCPT